MSEFTIKKCDTIDENFLYLQEILIAIQKQLKEEPIRLPEGYEIRELNFGWKEALRGEELMKKELGRGPLHMFTLEQKREELEEELILAELECLDDIGKQIVELTLNINLQMNTSVVPTETTSSSRRPKPEPEPDYTESRRKPSDRFRTSSTGKTKWNTPVEKMEAQGIPSHGIFLNFSCVRDINDAITKWAKAHVLLNNMMQAQLQNNVFLPSPE